MSGCKTTVNLTTFEANVAQGQVGGGGLFLTKSADDFNQNRVTYSVFRHNIAKFDLPNPEKGGGGAILVHGGLTVDRCALYENLVRSAFGGGGILFKDSKKSVVVNTAILQNISSQSDEIAVGLPPQDPWSGAGVSAAGSSYVEIVGSSLADNLGADEIYVEPGSSAEVALSSSLIDAVSTDATCGGDTLQVVSEDGHALQSKQQQERGDGGSFGKATCLLIPEGPIGSTKKTDGEFTPPLVGPTLKFHYTVPAAGSAADEGGSIVTCNTPPVFSHDLLDQLRGTTSCTVGAVELGGID